MLMSMYLQTMADSTAKSTRLAELAAERTILESKKEELLREYALIEASLKQNAIETAEFAPVYTLPDDVLMEIFETAYEHIPLDRRCALERNPTIPTQVCRRWRQTALAVPRLWSCLHVGRSAELLSLWLERSGSLPLHIICMGKDVDSRSSPGNPTTAHSTSWVRAYLHSLTNLLQHSSRWQHFDIETSHSVFLQTVLEVIGRTSFPSLRYLALWHTGHMNNLPSVVTLPDCPDLTELAVLRISMSFPPSTPLRHLKELYLGCGTFSDRDLLQLSLAAPGLVELTMDEVQCAQSTNGFVHTATFPHLKTLTFLITDWEDLFDWFNAPALETLICDQSPIWSDISSAIVVNPHRTFPALRELRLLRVVCQSWPNDGHLFRKTPNLDHLDLTGGTSTYCGVIDGLVSLEDTEDLLPKLEILTLTEVHHEYHDILMQFLRRRVHCERPLKELRLGRSLYASPEWQVWGLDKLVKVTRLTEEEEVVSPGVQAKERTAGVAYW